MWKALRSVCFVGSFVVLAGTGCTADGDVGRPCTLVKPNPEYATDNTKPPSIDVLEGEINVTRDYVAIGSLECEEFLCVRRSGTPITGDATASASGICSKPCLPAGDLKEQCPTASSDFRAECRGLILDEETLAALCQNNPAVCQDTVGSQRSSDFCVGASATTTGT